MNPNAVVISAMKQPQKSALLGFSLLIILLFTRWGWLGDYPSGGKNGKHGFTDSQVVISFKFLQFSSKIKTT